MDRAVPTMTMVASCENHDGARLVFVLVLVLVPSVCDGDDSLFPFFPSLADDDRAVGCECFG